MSDSALSADTPDERHFTLPCGCVAITRANSKFEVLWCAHHETLHGVITCDFSRISRNEERAYKQLARI